MTGGYTGDMVRDVMLGCVEPVLLVVISVLIFRVRLVTRAEHRPQITRQAFHHAPPSLGVAFAHCLHEGDAEHARGARREAYAHMAREARLVCGERGIVDMTRSELRLPPEREPRIRRNDAARGALQQASR
jgi:hypothetical protein